MKSSMTISIIGCLIFLISSVLIGQENILITEIHFDPFPDLPGDANGDGQTSNSEDEFIELVNLNMGPLDISDWTLSDKISVRHIFPNSTILEPGQAIVIFGGGSPLGDFGGAIIQLASSGSLALSNSGDKVTLSDGSGMVVDDFDYTDLSVDDESVTLFPNIYDNPEFGAHSSGLDNLLFSPGYSTRTGLKYLNKVLTGNSTISVLTEYKAATVLELGGFYRITSKYKGIAAQSINLLNGFELEDEAELELIIQKCSDGQ